MPKDNPSAKNRLTDAQIIAYIEQHYTDEQSLLAFFNALKTQLSVSVLTWNVPHNEDGKTSIFLFYAIPFCYFQRVVELSSSDVLDFCFSTEVIELTTRKDLLGLHHIIDEVTRLYPEQEAALVKLLKKISPVIYHNLIIKKSGPRNLLIFALLSPIEVLSVVLSKLDKQRIDEAVRKSHIAIVINCFLNAKLGPQMKLLLACLREETIDLLVSLPLRLHGGITYKNIIPFVVQYSRSENIKNLEQLYCLINAVTVKKLTHLLKSPLEHYSDGAPCTFLMSLVTARVPKMWVTLFLERLDRSFINDLAKQSALGTGFVPALYLLLRAQSIICMAGNYVVDEAARSQIIDTIECVIQYIDAPVLLQSLGERMTNEDYLALPECSSVDYKDEESRRFFVLGKLAQMAPTVFNILLDKFFCAGYKCIFSARIIPYLNTLNTDRYFIAHPRVTDQDFLDSTPKKRRCKKPCATANSYTPKIIHAHALIDYMNTLYQWLLAITPLDNSVAKLILEYSAEDSVSTDLMTQQCLFDSKTEPYPAQWTIYQQIEKQVNNWGVQNQGRVMVFSIKTHRPKHLTRIAENYGYICEPNKCIQEDSNSFFGAIIQQLAHQGFHYIAKTPAALRMITIHYMKQHATAYKNNLEKNGGIWTEHDFILSLSRALGMSIVIMHAQTPAPVIYRQSPPAPTLYCGFDPKTGYYSALPISYLIDRKRSRSLACIVESTPIDPGPMVEGVASVLKASGVTLEVDEMKGARPCF